MALRIVVIPVRVHTLPRLRGHSVASVYTGREKYPALQIGITLRTLSRGPWIMRSWGRVLSGACLGRLSGGRAVPRAAAQFLLLGTRMTIW